MTLAAGQRFADWLIEGEIGRGGMGIVYRAYDPALDRRVAIKLIRAELSEDVLFRMRFDRERKAHASLDHPSIVHVYSSGEMAGSLYVAMKLIDGPSLADLTARGPLSPEETLAILAPIGSALDHAHAQGPIHRDLKPQNILLDSDGRPFLTDFGLAWVPGHSRMTTTGAFMGTTAYASPEQLRGQSVGTTSDVYSLACVLYECLSGKVPFPRESASLDALEGVRGPSASNPSLPPGIDDVVRRGMAVSPASRYHSATALIDAARVALSRDGAGRGVRSGKSSRVFQARQSRLRPAFLTALVALGALGLFIGSRVEGDRSAPLTRTAQSRAVSLRFPRTAQSRAVSLRFPAGWRRVASAKEIDGLRFRQRIDLRSTNGSTLVAGMVAADGRFLLPPSYLATLSSPPMQEQIARLGPGWAYRYPRQPAGTRLQPVDLYVLPTTNRVATIACSSTGPADRDACATIAATLELRSARAFRLGPNSTYGRILDRTLGSLQRRRAVAYRQLDTAGTSAEQAIAAERIGDAFGSAEKRLARVKISPQSAPANAGVADALGGVAAAYANMAAAARSDSAAGYEHWRDVVFDREAGVQRALRRLQYVGYDVS